MSLGLAWVILALFVLGLGYLLFRGLRAYLKLRGRKLVTCPGNQKPARRLASRARFYGPSGSIQDKV